eukprot:Phypoly_transcript_04692.p1 GENE.Phypoly_transcript_04692~~Phypoly_transcript_04692.p1  ORF type:complete len:330 (+),score=48.98 Phypoly_transcript_04692:136-1125(+)
MSETESGEVFERLEFDKNGRVLPCFYFDPVSGTFAGPEILVPAVHELFGKVRNTLDATIKQATGSVFRCFALGANKNVAHTFTGFFIAPNILATCAHNLCTEPGTPFPYFIVCLLLGYAIPSRAFEKYSPMTVIYQPTLRTQTEPQMQRGLQGPDIAFLRVSDHTNDSWIYPSIESPSLGNNAITLQFNANLQADFIGRHKQFQHEDTSAAKVEAILYPHRLSASVGRVVAKNDSFVSYSLTSAPGASGGPVFSGNCEGFLAINRGSLFAQGTKEKLYDAKIANLGARVTQPEFAEAYEKFVVPELQKSGPLHPMAMKFLAYYNLEIST